MRLTSFAVVFALAATPALADDAADLAAAKATISQAKLSADSDLFMWCGATMLVFSQATKDSDPTKSQAASDASNVFFGKAATSMSADGVSTETDSAAITSAYMTEVVAQMVKQSDPPSHTADDCDPAKAK